MTRFDKVYWTTWLAIDFLAIGLYCQHSNPTIYASWKRER
jgi:hypothetical protein